MTSRRSAAPANSASVEASGTSQSYNRKARVEG
jgi:hypothetical protein